MDVIKLFKSKLKQCYYALNYRKNIMFTKQSQIIGKEMISVIIPIYDRTHQLIESIESILNQSYSNFELLLICDGSPDSTLEIVKKYEANPKVRAYYYQDNSGNAVRGRNRGIQEARGHFIAFQDSDDIAEPNRLKDSLYYMNKFDADIVYGGWRAKLENRKVDGIEDGEVIYSPECTEDSLKKVCIICQSTVVIRKSVLEKVGSFKKSMRYREDHELWLRIYHQGYRFKMIPRVLTTLRLHNNNLELRYKEEDEYWYNLMLQEYTHILPQKLKIAYVIPGVACSGGIAVICQQANRLVKRGYSVAIVSEDNADAITWFPNQGVPIIPINQFGQEVDVLIATAWSTAYTVQTMKAKRKLYFVQSDESRFYTEGSFEHERALNTYKMDFEFFTEARWIQKWLADKFEKQASYVPNGLDSNIIYKVIPLEPKSNKVRVLLEGAINSPFKGMEDAFNVIKDLECEVWCVSNSGKPKPGWRYDKFFENVPMERMKEIYSSCDILLKMSKVEGFFGPPLEMMACGGVCVTSKVTGYDEYIKDGYNALTVELGDIEAAKNAIRLLMEDQQLMNQLKENGLRTSKQWDWESSIDLLEKILEGVE